MEEPWQKDATDNIKSEIHETQGETPDLEQSINFSDLEKQVMLKTLQFAQYNREVLTGFKADEILEESPTSLTNCNEDYTEQKFEC